MFQDAHIRTIAKLVGAAAVIALLAYTYYAFVQARQIDRMPMTISVEGKGEVFAKPDIATFNFTVLAQEANAAAAQESSATRINDIIAYLKEKGIEDKDIKTAGYSLNPRYEYPRCNEFGCPGGDAKIVGYDVNQSVDVRVRKTDDLGMLIAGVTEMGATNLSGPSFTIDDEDSLKTTAREAAIADARSKAEALADKLGVRIVRMNGYWENQSYPMPYYGYGGDMMAKAESSVAPSMPVGENTITSIVNISYEVR